MLDIPEVQGQCYLKEVTYSPMEASIYLRREGNISHTPAYLGKLRTKGGGPAYIYVSRFVRYPKSELDAYIKRITSGRRTSTSSVTRPAASDCHAVQELGDDAGELTGGEIDFRYTGDRRFDEITRLLDEEATLQGMIDNAKNPF